MHTIPKQSIAAFGALSAAGDLTARQLGERLGILPNTAYRAARPLLEIGMIEKLHTHPARYRARPTADAKGWYMRTAMQHFSRDFDNFLSKPVNDAVPSITFIKDRTHLKTITEQEAQKAKKSINCILSGHRVADSTIRIYRKAVAREVRFRVIIENNPKNADIDIEAFKFMAAEVKFLPNIGIRLFIFDARTTVLTSYDPETPNRAFGIRFTYTPVAAQLDQLFEQRWSQAEKVASADEAIYNNRL